MSRPVSIALWIAAGPVLLALGAAVSFRTAGAFLMVLLSTVLGPIVGLSSSAPYFTLQFKLSLAAGLVATLGLVWAGVRSFEKPWGRPLLLVGAIGWTLCGAMGFGPQ